MEVEIVNKPKRFTPVTIQITFETKKELEVFKMMVQQNVEIPSILLEGGHLNNQDEEVLLSELQERIYNIL